MEALSVLQECDTTNQFLILFGKLSGNKFRGLYSVNNQNNHKSKKKDKKMKTPTAEAINDEKVKEN